MRKPAFFVLFPCLLGLFSACDDGSNKLVIQMDKKHLKENMRHGHRKIIRGYL
jgi:hypothetical protein